MKSLKSLLSFVWYCVRHPKERFWQALRNWSKHDYIYVSASEGHLEDTFYWE
jgi:hypothetical protein